MEDQTKADIDTPRFMQYQLDPTYVGQEDFIRGLEIFINMKLEKKGKRRYSEGSEDVDWNRRKRIFDYVKVNCDYTNFKDGVDWILGSHHNFFQFKEYF